MRQRRIISNSAEMVKPGGYLAYMTCTYSLDENEKLIEWFLKNSPSFVVETVPGLEGYESVYSEFPSYRLWPQRNEGAGGFTVLLRRSG